MKTSKAELSIIFALVLACAIILMGCPSPSEGSLTGITVTQTPTGPLTPGESRRFEAHPVPPEATLPAITWTVTTGTGGTLGDASINSAGSLTTTAATNGLLVVTASGGGFSAAANVTVQVEVIVTPATVIIAPGTNQQFTAVAIPAGVSLPAISWTVTAGTGGTLGDASINANGLLTTATNTDGALVVTASGSGFTRIANVTVQAGGPPGLEDIIVTMIPTRPLTAGQARQFIATAFPPEASLAGLVWSVTPPTTGVAIGATTGTLTTTTVTPYAALTVTATVGSTYGTTDLDIDALPPSLTGITVTPNSVTLYAGDAETFTVEPVPYEAALPATIAWTVTPDVNASINTHGNLTTQAATTGTPTVRASGGGFSSTAIVTIRPVEP